MKLYYFAMKGRAESARLCMWLSGKKFEDVQFPFDEWGAKYKAQSPAGQAPWVEFDDGRALSQSLAINIHFAEIAGYLPSDPMKLARTAELYCAIEEWFDVLGPTFEMEDLEERVKARKKLLEPDGQLSKKLAAVEKLVEAVKTPYYCGDELTLADIIFFCNFAACCSGMMDGMGKEELGQYSNMMALRDKIAAVPKIKEIYNGVEGFEA